jgi:hypothetical protein
MSAASFTEARADADARCAAGDSDERQVPTSGEAADRPRVAPDAEAVEQLGVAGVIKALGLARDLAWARSQSAASPVPASTARRRRRGSRRREHRGARA